jgi:hypothetical protein
VCREGAVVGRVLYGGRWISAASKEAIQSCDSPLDLPLRVVGLTGGPQARERARTLPGPPTSILEMSSSSSSRILRILMVESSQPMARYEEDLDAASAKMGGRVGSVDCTKVSFPFRNPNLARTYLHASNLFPSSWTSPFPFHKLTSDSSDSKQPHSLALISSHFMLRSRQISIVQGQVRSAEGRLVGEDEVREKRGRLLRVAQLGEREGRRDGLGRKRAGVSHVRPGSRLPFHPAHECHPECPPPLRWNARAGTHPPRDPTLVSSPDHQLDVSSRARDSQDTPLCTLSSTLQEGGVERRWGDGEGGDS